MRQPWAWAIIHGGKDVENRTRNIAGSYRGPVLIHAASKTAALTDAEAEFLLAHDVDGKLDAWMGGEPIEGSVIIGVVDLVDVHTASVIGGCGRLRHDCPDHGTCRVHCSEWAQGPSADGWFQHLVFANPRALDEPIPYKGGLGLRKTDFAIVNDYLVAPWGHGPRSCTPYGCEPWCEFEPVAKLTAVTR